MKNAVSRSSQGTLVVALTALLLLAGSGVASAGSFPPDKQTGGAVGEYAFFAPEVNCVYQAAHPLRIEKFVIKPPSAPWPDQSSENTNEHGKVDWRATLQQSADEKMTWETVFTTSTQTKTASESAPAAFTKRTITWHSGEKVYFRVIMKVHWHGKGTIKHWVNEYKRSGGQNGGISGGCANRFLPA